MKRGLLVAVVAGLVCVSTNVASAAPKCSREESAVRRAESVVRSAERSVERLQMSFDTRQESAERRLASLEDNLVRARAYAQAANVEAIGRGLSCLLERRPSSSCRSSATRNLFSRVSRGRASVKSAESRVNSQKKLMERQTARYTKNIEKRQAELVAKQSALAAKEAALQACLATP